MLGADSCHSRAIRELEITGNTGPLVAFLGVSCHPRYPEPVQTAGESIADRAAAAAGRTVEAGTARLFAAWCTGSPLPETADRRCDGLADLATRRAKVLQSLFFTDGWTAKVLAEHGDSGHPELLEQSEMIYDGANAYIRAADRWTGFFLVDPSGPRGVTDPLWPLDTLFGASDDAVQIGSEFVRGVPATRCRLTVDLARADAALPAGVSVPSGPCRLLSALPAEIWLDTAGLARRISVCSDPTTAADKRVWSIVELWDFGLPVAIMPPRPDEVLPPAEAYRQAHDDASGPGA
jgi:hypothetical protein